VPVAQPLLERGPHGGRAGVSAARHAAASLTAGSRIPSALRISVRFAERDSPRKPKSCRQALGKGVADGVAEQGDVTVLTTSAAPFPPAR
jgi:hypothetical protein